MNNQLITKIIKTGEINACPEFTYENPLIDRNIAGALARSFVKMLRVSQHDSNINKNLRHSVLANIRKLCRTEPENHIEIDENFTKSLSELYMNSLNTKESTKCVERALDAFLLKRLKEADVNSNYQCSINPEVAQALLNLNENHSCAESIYKDLIHWNCDNKNLALVKNLWTNTSLTHSISSNICDEMSVKMRSEIEVILLNYCHCLLTEPNLETEEFSANSTLMDLVKKCTMSMECFEICIRILNYLFINTNYNGDIRIFIWKFIKNVKDNCLNSIHVLYPINLGFIVVLLDIDIETLPDQYKTEYVKQTLVHLKRLEKESDNDLLLLLSHYPQWLQFFVTEL